ncbi:MAG: glycosyltransferase family 2 protein [Rikenellaceae bacterium]|nr:glycosyltransferase family 2 protein [Rikenellaceae bacterium]
MDISVIVPAFNEADSIPELSSWIEKVMDDNSFSYEIIFINDGSSDKTWNTIENLHVKNKCIKGIDFRRNYGKSAALYSGFEAAQGDVVITMDADLQDSPDEIPELYRMITEEGYDMVSGWKKKRFDPKGKTIPSKFFNSTARLVSGIKLHDFNCGLKAYKKKVVKSIEVYGEMHRFIPIIVKKAGFTQIGEKVVNHSARKYGCSKYGWERMIKGYLDLLTVLFITRFGKSPMYLFGGGGTFMFLLGGVIAIWLIAEKLSIQGQGLAVRPVTDQPLFFLSLTSVIIGAQMFLAGFLGELISRQSSDRNTYLIDDVIDIDNIKISKK